MPAAFGATAPQPPEHLGDFLFDQILWKPAHAAARLLLEWIEPLASLEQIRRSHGTVSQGAVSPACVTQ